MWRKGVTFLGFFYSMTYVYAFNMAYVEVNTNHLKNASCFIRSDNKQPFFGLIGLFAANINGANPNEPRVYFNEHVQAVLKSAQIKELHQHGIKVLLTLLGNHENAGWACMTSETSAKKFANDIVDMVNAYQLDGIDIDDEYSACQTNTYSLIMLAQAIKDNPGFKGKLLTKALFNDYKYFKADYKNHKLAEYLDYGWEMTYSNSNFDSRLEFYLRNGMTRNKLMIGAWAANTYPDPYALGQYTMNKLLAGAMIYDVTRDSYQYLNQLINGISNDETNIELLPECLQ